MDDVMGVKNKQKLRIMADEQVARNLIKKDDLWHNFEKFNYIKLILNDIIENNNDTNELGDGGAHLFLCAWLLQNKPSRECQEVQYELHGLDVFGWVCYL